MNLLKKCYIEDYGYDDYQEYAEHSKTMVEQGFKVQEIIDEEFHFDTQPVSYLKEIDVTND